LAAAAQSRALSKRVHFRRFIAPAPAARKGGVLESPAVFLTERLTGPAVRLRRTIPLNQPPLRCKIRAGPVWSRESSASEVHSKARPFLCLRERFRSAANLRIRCRCLTALFRGIIARSLAPVPRFAFEILAAATGPGSTVFRSPTSACSMATRFLSVPPFLFFSRKTFRRGPF